MSASMVDDHNQMNKWNPFVNEREMLLPGVVRRNGDFDDYDEVVTDKSWGVPKAEPSPLCAVASTMGDRTVDFCRPPKPNCSDKRSMHPKRYIDLGWTCRNPRGGAPGPTARAPRSPRVIKPAPRTKLFTRPMIILLLTLLILFQLV